MQRIQFIIKKYLKSRIFVFFISILLLFAMFSSVLLIAANAEHDCTGDDCPICACIHQCESCLSLLSGGCAAVFSFVIINDYIVLLIKTAADKSKTITLITQKVRLND